jgi:hypothetical protein
MPAQLLPPRKPVMSAMVRNVPHVAVVALAVDAAAALAKDYKLKLRMVDGSAKEPP